MAEDLHYEGGKVTLPAVLDLTKAADLKDCLLGAMTVTPNVSVDATSLQRITTPCLQVFVAAARDLQAEGGSLQFSNVPDSMAQAAAILGLSSVLGLAEV